MRGCLCPGHCRAGNGRTLALLLAQRGWGLIRLGRFAQAEAAFARCRACYEELAVAPPPEFGTDPLAGLALLAHIVGDYPRALALGPGGWQLIAHGSAFNPAELQGLGVPDSLLP